MGSLGPKVFNSGPKWAYSGLKGAQSILDLAQSVLRGPNGPLGIHIVVLEEGSNLKMGIYVKVGFPIKMTFG